MKSLSVVGVVVLLVSIPTLAEAADWKLLGKSPTKCSYLKAFNEQSVVCVQRNFPSTGLISTSTTTDGGETWSTAAAGPVGLPLAVTPYWRDAQTGFAGRAGTNGDKKGLTWKTPDGGKTWALKLLPNPHLSVQVSGIHFAGAIGYAVGFQSEGASPKALIARSTDNGETWTEQPFPSAASTTTELPAAIATIDANTAVVITDKGLWRTTDAGANWKQITGVTVVGGAWIKFVDATHGYALGGSLFKTSDGGATWTPATLPTEATNQDLRAIDFADENNGVVAHADSGPTIAGKFWRTTDGAKTWTEEARPADWLNIPSSIAFPSAKVAYASGFLPEGGAAVGKPSVVRAGVGSGTTPAPAGGADAGSGTGTGTGTGAGTSGGPDGTSSSGSSGAPGAAPAADDGCTMHARSSRFGGGAGLAGLAIGVFALLRRRREMRA